MNECYFLKCDDSETAIDRPFINLLSNSLETLDVKTVDLTATNFSVTNLTIDTIQATNIYTLYNGFYNLMPYESNERSDGSLYVIPPGGQNVFTNFKGPTIGILANRMTSGASYRITYAMSFSNPVSSVFTVRTQFVNNIFGICSAIVPTGISILQYNLYITVLSSTSTTTDYDSYSTMTVFGNNTLGSGIMIDGARTLTGFPANSLPLNPQFTIRSDQPGNWIATRREYNFIRVS